MTIRIFQNGVLIQAESDPHEFIRDTQCTYFNEWECESDVWKNKLQFEKIPITVEECINFLKQFGFECDVI